MVFPCPVWQGFERVWALCGFRFRDYVSITDCVEVPNSSPFPEDTFRVTVDDVRKCVFSLPENMEILGFLHNHPEECFLPSFDDLEGIDEGMFGVVACDGNYTWYNRDGVFTPQLLG